jgi:hypothetical protein
MKTLRVLSIGMLVLVLVASTTIAGPVQTWDDQINNATRFRVLNEFNGEAVLDRETGLVWEIAPTFLAQDWGNRAFDCLARNIGGRRGWRLASIHELLTLVEPTASNPALPAGHPFLNVSSLDPHFFWSATASAQFDTAAYYMTLFNGTPNDTLKTFSFRAWCVRGGGPLTEY